MNRFERRSAYQLVFLLILAAIPAAAQAASATIAISFNPSTVLLNGQSTQTITITNPNAVPLTNVSFSDVEPAGITLITQTGGTCSTLATGGGMFSINPGTGTFSSTSNVLAAGQSCIITVSVRGTALGAFLNTTSTVTSNEASPGGSASATLTVTGTSVLPAPPSLILMVTGLLSLLAWWLLRSRRTASLI